MNSSTPHPFSMDTSKGSVTVDTVGAEYSFNNGFHLPLGTLSILVKTTWTGTP